MILVLVGWTRKGLGSWVSRGANLRWALGGITCNFTPILPYFQLWGDEPWPRFLSGEQIKWRPKKRSSPKERKLCSPNSSGDLRSNAHQSQIIGGMQMQTILKLLGEIQSNWGNIFPHLPEFRHPCRWEHETKADKSWRNRFVGNNHQSRGTKQSLATHPPFTQ